jgi:hypothetical protein
VAVLCCNNLQKSFQNLERLWDVRFEVLIVVLLKMPVFWDVTLCHWVRGLKGLQHVHLQQSISWRRITMQIQSLIATASRSVDSHLLAVECLHKVQRGRKWNCLCNQFQHFTIRLYTAFCQLFVYFCIVVFYFERKTSCLGTVFYQEEVFGLTRDEESTEWRINEDFHMPLL